MIGGQTVEDQVVARLLEARRGRAVGAQQLIAQAINAQPPALRGAVQLIVSADDDARPPADRRRFRPSRRLCAESKSDSPSSLVIATLSIVGATVSIKPGNRSAPSGLFSSP